ncbi:hypothetical protein F4774DRAFT_384865 [Daldinia eschscholtzii]|nr:hypothetical protein F4774DRAFT_384865 [Daldinia eschscholtzii]
MSEQDQQVDPVDHPTADGRVLLNGKFRCNCGAVMANKKHNISSHISKKHREGSAFQKAEEINRRSCGICGFTAIKFHMLVTHVRNEHGFRGETRVLQDQYATTQVDESILVPANQCTG